VCVLMVLKLFLKLSPVTIINVVVVVVVVVIVVNHRYMYGNVTFHS
jgi:hypothetical protein